MIVIVTVTVGDVKNIEKKGEGGGTFASVVTIVPSPVYLFCCFAFPVTRERSINLHIASEHRAECGRIHSICQ